MPKRKKKRIYPVPEAFKSMIREAMEKQGMSLRDVGAKAKVSASGFHRFLLGERKLPTNDVLIKIAKALEIDPPQKLLYAANRFPSQGEPPTFRESVTTMNKIMSRLTTEGKTGSEIDQQVLEMMANAKTLLEMAADRIAKEHAEKDKTNG